MVRSTRTLIPLLIVCLLFTGCGGPVNSEKANTKDQISAKDICPGQLKSNPTCLTPHTLRAAYGIDSLIQKGFTGKGQTIINITSFSSPTLHQDMDVFNRTFNLPPIDLQVISPLNAPESDPHRDKAAWEAATIREVQIMHALAPEAKVIVLQSQVAETQGTVGLPEFRQLQEYLVNQQLGHIVSMTWNVSELTLQDLQGQQELQKWDNLLRQGTMDHHITYFAPSGATGATNFIDDNEHLGKVPVIGFSASSPWVTSVGWTSLTRTGPTLSETAWNGSGGGFSRFYEIPSYQKMLPTEVHQQFNNQRGIPDVSAASDPNTGLAVYLRGQWRFAGGNISAAAWSGIQAIANQMAGRPLGFINPGLYKLAASNTYHQDFRDITEGNNSNLEAGVKGHSAGPGWDPITGLGTPNAEKLIPDLIKALE